MHLIALLAMQRAHLTDHFAQSTLIIFITVYIETGPVVATISDIIILSV